MKTQEKFYYIGEVSKIVNVPTHILRFWEKEFSSIHPLRDQKGHRIYKNKDIEKINNIKHLVYNKGYRIQGAKKKLRENISEKNCKPDKEIILKILREIKDIKKCLQ
jgi:DNA-binding transcriptional MerR regulator